MLNPFLFGYGAARVAGGLSAGMEAGRAQGEAMRAAAAVRYLEQRVDQLSLVCMAMWSLLRDQTNLTEEQLAERVRQIDLLDGNEDGKFVKEIAKCDKCGRVMSPRHPRCMYCGAEKLNLSAFDRVL